MLSASDLSSLIFWIYKFNEYVKFKLGLDTYALLSDLSV